MAEERVTPCAATTQMHAPQATIRTTLTRRYQSMHEIGKLINLCITVGRLRRDGIGVSHGDVKYIAVYYTSGNCT